MQERYSWNGLSQHSKNIDF